MILIVDDDPGVLRLLERTLKREGFCTATAGSGQAAIAWLANNTPEIMLLDLQLPDMGGKALIAHLEQTGRSVPFIIITGQGDERVAVEMMKQGALDYLVKDVQFVGFVPLVVHRALAQLAKDQSLIATQTALKESQNQLLLISERERTRFATELHDGLGQQLTAIELLCQSIKEDLPADRPDLIQQISQIGEFLREAITQTRSLARNLSPVKLGSGRLLEALDELAARMSKDGKIRCVLDLTSAGSEPEVFVASHLFRIAQEAVTNAVKHSGATDVVIRFLQRGGARVLEISDNGRGLPTETRADSGIGLQNMKHRSSVIGAELEIKSRLGKGVTVTCTLPSQI